MTDAFHIIVPCKSFGEGKSRLATVLESPARRALCQSMLTHTLDVATRMAPLASIWLVSPELAPPAGFAGINIVVEQRPDLNAALNDARRAILARHGAANILVLPIDLPAVSAESILAAIDRDADVILAADESGQGTNLMFLRACVSGAFDFRYGADSFARHVATANDLNARWAAVDDPRLAFDLDEPGHYARYGALQAAGTPDCLGVEDRYRG